MTYGYFEVLEVYGFEIQDMRKPFVALVQKLFSFGLCGLMEKYLKYETANMLSLCLDSERPPIFDGIDWSHIPGTLFSSGLGRKIFLRIAIRKRIQDVSLALSLNKVKEISEPLLPHHVQQALNENLEELTKEELPTYTDIDLKTELVYQVRRTVREAYAIAVGHGWKLNSNARIPSLNASYENSRKRGGALSVLFESGELIDRVLGFHTLVGYFMYGLNPTPYYTLDDPQEIRNFLTKELLRSSDPIETRRAAILEPFKVRIVSAGKAEPYQIAKNYQNTMWSMLRCVRSFALIGEPFTDQDVEDCCRLPRETGIYSVLVSGDYKSATDNLDPDLSEAALDEFCALSGVPFEDYIVLRSALTKHLIDGIHPQKWGQLMGSPVSFPILNIVNWAVTRFVREEAYHTMIPMLLDDTRVNGDDILFSLPPGHYQRWCEVVSTAGLTPSLGKNYYSREYCMINSKMYRVPEDWDRKCSPGCSRFSNCIHGNIKRVPIINLGLIRGPSCSLKAGRSVQEWFNRSDEPWSPYELGDAMREACSDWDEKTQGKIISKSIHYASPLLKLLPSVSWFASRDLGGLGLPTDRDPSLLIKDHHRRLCAWMSCWNSTQAKEFFEHHTIRMSNRAFFAEVSLSSYIRACEQAGIPYVRVPKDYDSSEDEIPILPDLLFGNLRLSLDDCPPERDYISSWMKQYHRWIKLANAARSGLHLMDPEKCVEGLPWKWERDFTRSWTILQDSSTGGLMY
ncbi:RNA-dependent RNA polymerase [Tetranychus urticae-associated narnavirus]|nr:RNA-dependent RNA polymerase [Tetranychus urticae-associated narnavirus]